MRKVTSHRCPKTCTENKEHSEQVKPRITGMRSPENQNELIKTTQINKFAQGALTNVS